jgi:four helix bundle protein
VEDVANGSYRQLIAWQRGMLPAESVYRFTRTLPRDERFGMAAQLQRAAVSVPANLAEGHCRRTRGAYAQHVSIALGSQGDDL